METIAEKMDALIKANLALHVARSSPMPPTVSAHRSMFVTKQEEEVRRRKDELTQELMRIFGE
jgi:hypothetical protein